jgi:hypothetical protein
VSVPDEDYSNLLALSVPDEDYSNLLAWSVPDEDYSRNTSPTQNLISTFSLCSFYLFILEGSLPHESIETNKR